MKLFLYFFFAFEAQKLDLQSMDLLKWNPSDKLSARLQYELETNLKLLINFNLYVLVLPLWSSFLIGPEKVIYLSGCSPKHSNLPSNSFASSLIIKW